MPTDEKLEKYKNSDGEIDWGKYAEEQLLADTDGLKEKKESLPVENLSVFKLADALSDYIWNIVLKWDYFPKKTIGDQWVRSTDSIAANITEGYGRYFFGEYLLFLYYARGSLYESIFWTEKAHKRKLINEQEYKYLKDKLDKMPLEINKVIKIVKSESKKWKGKPKY